MVRGKTQRQQIRQAVGEGEIGGFQPNAVAIRQRQAFDANAANQAIKPGNLESLILGTGKAVDQVSAERSSRSDAQQTRDGKSDQQKQRSNGDQTTFEPRSDTLPGESSFHLIPELS